MNVPSDIAQRYAAAICEEIEALGSSRSRETPVLERMLVGLPVPDAAHVVMATVVSLAEYRLRRRVGICSEV